MSWLRHRMPHARLPVVAAHAATVCVAFAVAGCASQQATPQSDARPGASIVARVDTEADGQPAQPPPPISIRTAPDDPREPWSRNYGSVTPVRGAEALVASPAVAALAPPALPSSARPPAAAASPIGRMHSVPSTAAALPADLPPDFRLKLAEAGYR